MLYSKKIGLLVGTLLAGLLACQSPILNARQESRALSDDRAPGHTNDTGKAPKPRCIEGTSLCVSYAWQKSLRAFDPNQLKVAVFSADKAPKILDLENESWCFIPYMVEMGHGANRLSEPELEDEHIIIFPEVVIPMKGKWTFYLGELAPDQKCEKPHENPTEKKWLWKVIWEAHV